jgi:hypothetical protein
MAWLLGIGRGTRWRLALLGVLLLGWPAQAGAQGFPPPEDEGESKFPPVKSLSKIDTPYDAYITPYDSINKRIRTKGGFDVTIINPKLMSSTCGEEIEFGFEDYYLYVFRSKRVQVEGAPLRIPKQKIKKHVDRKRPAERPETRMEQTQQAANAQPKDKQPAETKQDTSQQQQEGANGKGPAGQAKPGFFKRLFGGLFGGKKDTTQADTAAADTAAAQQPQADKPPQDQGPTEKRIVTKEKKLYAYIAVISRRKRLDSIPDTLNSRALFMKGIIDKTDSLPEFDEMQYQAEKSLDSLRYELEHGETEMTKAVKEKLELFKKNYRFHRRRYELYQAFDKAKGGLFKQSLNNFFLSHFFYAENLKYNIKPMPWGLPEYLMEEKQRPRKKKKKRDKEQGYERPYKTSPGWRKQMPQSEDEGEEAGDQQEEQQQEPEPTPAQQEDN